MIDARVIAGIFLMGLAAALVKAVELWDWHVNRHTLQG